MKTVLFVLFLIAAVLWLPIYVQVICFILAIILIKYNTFILFPAILADSIYAPTTNFSFFNFKLTLLVGFLILIHWFFITKTRIGSFYDKNI